MASVKRNLAAGRYGVWEKWGNHGRRLDDSCRVGIGRAVVRRVCCRWRRKDGDGRKRLGGAGEGNGDFGNLKGGCCNSFFNIPRVHKVHIVLENVH